MVRDGVLRMLDAVGLAHAAVLRSACKVAVAHPVDDLAAGHLWFLSVRRISAGAGCAALVV